MLKFLGDISYYSGYCMSWILLEISMPFPWVHAKVLACFNRLIDYLCH